MPDNDLSFEGFLSTVNPVYQDFVQSLHAFLLGEGCKLKLQTAKGGDYVVSYIENEIKGRAV